MFIASFVKRRSESQINYDSPATPAQANEREAKLTNSPSTPESPSETKLIQAGDAPTVSPAPTKPRKKLSLLALLQRSPEEKQQQKQEKNIQKISRMSNEEVLAKMDQKWLSQLRQFPGDAETLIHGHLNMVLLTESHRFGKVIPTFVQSWKAKYQNLFESSDYNDKDLELCCTDVKNFVEDLIYNIYCYYNQLYKTSVDVNMISRNVIESILFDEIYPIVFETLSKKFKSEDDLHTRKIKDYLTITPSHLGIPHHFWLFPHLEGEHEMADTPYSKAITTLKKLSTLKTPVSKVKCLVNTARSIISCIELHWNETAKFVVGGDELLPLFTYVLIKADIQNIYTQAKFLEYFMAEEHAIQEAGYLLVTVQTCLSIISRLENSVIEESAAQLISKMANHSAVPESLLHSSISSQIKECD